MPTPAISINSFWSLTPITTTNTETTSPSHVSFPSPGSSNPDASPLLPPRPVPNTSNTPSSIHLHVWIGKDFKIPKFTPEFSLQSFATEHKNRKEMEQWKRNPLLQQFGVHVGRTLCQILKFVNEDTPWVIVVEEEGAESKEFFSHLSR